ncbi:MAG TPA: hypothetical protein ENJ82_08745 [Bacteroidetes bacterium]|nr:hypothetical protein [Bacteroidota bacterium]
MENKFEMIVEALKEKACLKQAVYRSSLVTFKKMKAIAKSVAEALADRFAGIDKSVVIEYKEINEFEFYLKFSGDLLIFTMHSNISTVTEEHLIAKSPYVQENPNRGYFGHIMVYNFMADSLKYKRYKDPGYLIARMMLNEEDHFYIEGVRQLNFLHPDIAQNKVSDELLKLFIESAMLTAVGQDLYVPNYQDVQVVPLGSKMENQMVSGGFKVGFQMVKKG